MPDSKSVSIPSHLWEALDTMSAEMGVGRDALVAQAVFTLARLNGYVVAGRALQPGASSPSGVSSAPPAPAPTPAVAPAAPPGLKPASAPSKPAPVPPPPAPAVKPAAPSFARKPAPEPQPDPESDEADAPDDDGNPFDDEAPPSDSGGDEYRDDAPVDDELPPDDDAPPEDDLPVDDDVPEDPPPPPPRVAAGKQTLTLVMANRDPYKMTTDVMTIGRGKTCEFVIESNRVSREHARISREAGGYVLEDLQSSNGTFFGPNKEKVVSKRPIRDGDEFTFGTEKVRFQIRK